MIDRNEMMETIVNASPELTHDFSEFVSEWSDDLETPYYLFLADYSRYLVSLLESEARQQLSSAFDAIESLYRDGDDYVENAVTVGIFESLQNKSLHRSTSPDQFVEYLQPLSLKNWHELTAYLNKVHGIQ